MPSFLRGLATVRDAVLLRGRQVITFGWSPLGGIFGDMMGDNPYVKPPGEEPDDARMVE